MAKPFVWGPGGAQMTPEQIAAEKKVANALMMRGSDYSPVQHWTQGAARVAQGLMGGLDWRMADEAGKRNTAKDKEILTNLMPLFQGGSTPPTPATPASTPSVAAPSPAYAEGTPNARVADAFSAIQPAPAAPVSRPGYGDAIAGIESGGKYNALGPVIPKTGDRAYGKYQIMGANVPAWTRAHLGQEMTPQAFLASPEAQDAVFKAQFGQYVNKYGPEGAARAWFAGEGGMNNPNARDVLGTSVADYSKKFTTALGGAAPTDVSAQRATAAAPVAQNDRVMASIFAAMSDPAASDTTKAIGRMLLQQRLQGDNIQTIDLGDTVGVMDKRGNVLKHIPKGQKPGDAPTVQRIKQADGSEVAVQWDATNQTWTPLKAPEGGNPVTNPKLTEQQSKDVGFYNRGVKLIPRLEQQDRALTDALSAAGGSVPLAGNYFKSDAYRQAENTGRELLAVILRKDTGAAVTPQEFEMYGSIYLPRAGDDAATLQQKRAARKTAIDGLRMGLGTAEIIFKSREALEGGNSPAPGAPPAGTVEDGYRFKGGNPADPNAWERIQ